MILMIKYLYKKSAIDNFNIFLRPKLSEIIIEEELTLKNAIELVSGRQWVINTFESGVFLMRAVNVVDEVDHYIYDDELHPERGLQKPH